MPPQSFADLAVRIQREPTLLHPSPEILAQSYRDGYAVAALQPGTSQIIGYARLEPTIGEPVRRALGLSAAFPNVMEAGTMFVDPDPAHRGNGHLPALLKTLFGAYSREIASGELLVLGTAKTVRVFQSLDDIEAAKFDAMHPHDLKFLAALTCLCTGNFGQGYQYGVDACPNRIGDDALGRTDLMQELTSRAKGASPKTPCAMFVSSRSVAAEANAELQRVCGGDIGYLITVLKEAQFYGPLLPPMQ